MAITLAVTCVLAVIVLAAGALLAKRSERVRLPEPGNRLEAEYREVSRQVDVLEEQWQQALEKESRGMLASSANPDLPGIVGVAQSSLLNSRLSDPARAHRRTDGKEVSIKPVLERFAKKELGEWVFSENAPTGDARFVEEPGRPPAFVQGNGSAVAVLLLDSGEAARVAEEEIARRFSGEPPAGFREWLGPTGRLLQQSGEKPPAEVPPDELYRHVSRFGDWTLRRWFPVTVKTSWRTPVLAGAFTLSGLIVAGGVAVAAGQRKALRVAGERVSFVNRVSHELRTPLTNLLLNTDLAIDDLDVTDAKARRRLGLIREETGRLSRIVDNVLAFARLERKHAVTSTDCDPDRIVGKVAENFAPLFQRKSIACDFEGRVGHEVRLDGDAFAQILSNLLSNVEKYAGENARASVRVSGGPNRLVVEVEDDGPGVPAAARQRVFLPFERAVSSTREGTSGTGLGLAISRELAERMGGSLELLATGPGTCFRLTLPYEERTEG